MTKKLTVIAIGSRGDVQPYIALSIGLKQAGYQVRLATHSEFGPVIVERGLDFFPLATNPSEVLDTHLGQNWLSTDNHPLRFGWFFVKLMRPLLEELLPSLWESCQGSDAIIYSRLGAAGLHAAEKLGVPGIMTSLQPVGTTSAFPAVGGNEAPGWFPSRTFYNRASHLVTDQLFWQPFRGIINRWRRDYLGLPPAPFRGTYDQLAAKGGPLLLAHSESLVPSPPDWPDWIYTTGFWMLDHNETYHPPEKLCAFLEEGPPPVQIGFGSMRFDHPDRIIDMAVTALERCGQRGIVNLPWPEMGGLTLTPEIMTINDVPFDWLFPQLTAVVNHGGVGTLTTALRAGIPSAVVPFYADQHFWTNHAVANGAAIGPISRKGLTADILTDAIQTITGDPEIRRNAQRLGALLNEEDGVGKAVELIGQYV